MSPGRSPCFKDRGKSPARCRSATTGRRSTGSRGAKSVATSLGWSTKACDSRGRGRGRSWFHVSDDRAKRMRRGRCGRGADRPYAGGHGPSISAPDLWRWTAPWNPVGRISERQDQITESFSRPERERLPMKRCRNPQGGGLRITPSPLPQRTRSRMLSPRPAVDVWARLGACAEALAAE